MTRNQFDVIVVGDRLIEERPAAVQAVASSSYRRMGALLADPAALGPVFAGAGGPVRPYTDPPSRNAGGTS